MLEDIGIEVVLVGMRQRFLNYALKIIEVNAPGLDQKNDIGKIGVEAAVQFAQGDAESFEFR